jgi:hypothetical protein
LKCRFTTELQILRTCYFRADGFREAGFLEPEENISDDTSPNAATGAGANAPMEEPKGAVLGGANSEGAATAGKAGTFGAKMLADVDGNADGATPTPKLEEPAPKGDGTVGKADD